MSPERIADAVEAAMEEIWRGERSRRLGPGAKIAVTAGSRGIANYAEILRHAVRWLKSRGYRPFLFSAMGSHGRGEEEGQQEVLTSLGITGETVGCEVSCSSSVERIGLFEAFGREIPVYCAKEALESDGIVVINRVKPHTSFHGDYESGLLKMMAVGMGRAPGAEVFHSLGAAHLPEMLPLIAVRVLERAPVVGGIGIVENEREQTAIVEGIPHHLIFEREKALLERARSMKPRLPVKRADLLIVGEMGKNFSGTGMDTGVIGRIHIHGIPEPQEPSFTYIGVLRLSEESHGNATGIGLADLTTEALVRRIDKKATYYNCATSGFVKRAAIPMTFPDDRTLVEEAVRMLRISDLKRLRMVAIRNTLHIHRLWVSEAVWREIENLPGVEPGGRPRPISFDEYGNWIWQD